MATVLPQNPTVKPLPAFIRQRLTLQSALLSNPLEYFNAKHSKRSRRIKKVIKERASPKPSVVSETTQTKDVLDAETNTKMGHCLTIESQKSKLKSKCTTAWVKGAVIASSPFMEIIRLLNLDSNYKQNKSDKDSLKSLPVKRRGILKKVVEDLTLEGMCSTATTTETKIQPTLDRLLKENTLFLKYSKSCKTKKKRVRMDKKPALSYFSKKDPESVQSMDEAPNQESKPSLQASKDERPKRIDISDDNGYSSESSDDTSLERKPARLALRAPRTARRDSDATLGVLDASDDSIASCLSNMCSVPQLSFRVKKSEKGHKRPRCRKSKDRLYSKRPSRRTSEDRLYSKRPPRRTSKDRLYSKRPSRRTSKDQLYSKRPPCRVPKDRLYFKNLFNFPGMLVQKW